MLLIQDHQPEVGDGREQGRAGADHHPQATLGNGQPLVVPFGVGQSAVEDRDFAAPSPKPGDCLRSQGDFRNQDDGPSTLFQASLQGSEVDLGLARAGDAEEKEVLVFPILKSRANLVHAFLLAGGESGRRKSNLGASAKGSDFSVR